MKLVVECHEGRVVSLFLENGFLPECVERGFEVVVVSPAAELDSFVGRYGGDGISWVKLPAHRSISRMETVEMKIGRWLTVRGHKRFRRALWEAFGERLAASGRTAERRLLTEHKPDVVFSPHVAEPFGRYLVAAASRLGFTTVGNLASWDNAFRPLQARPDRLTCWSERNRNELVELCGYEPQHIEVVGAPAFDPYVADERCGVASVCLTSSVSIRAVPSCCMRRSARFGRFSTRPGLLQPFSRRWMGECAATRRLCFASILSRGPRTSSR